MISGTTQNRIKIILKYMVKNKKSNILCFFIVVFLLNCCSNNNKNDAQGAVIVSDSVFLDYYLSEKFDRIVNGNFKIDSDLKRGLYSASFSELGRYKEAKESITNFDKLEFTYGINHEIKHYPSVYPSEIGSYEIYAIYKYATLKDNQTPKEVSYVLSNILEKDSSNVLAKVEYEYADMVYYNYSTDEFLKLISSLKAKYPHWKKLNEYEAEFYETKGDNLQALAHYKSLVRMNYRRKKNLEKIVFIFLDSIHSMDSAKYYSSIINANYKKIGSVAVGLYYQKSGQALEATNEFKLCVQDTTLSFEENMFASLCYLGNLIEVEKYDEGLKFINVFYNTHNSNLITPFERTKLYEAELMILLYSGKYTEYIKLIKNNGYGNYLFPNYDGENDFYKLTKDFYFRNKKMDTTKFQQFYIQMKGQN